MAKIETKAALVRGTNYKLHVVNIDGNDIQIDVTGGQILSSSTDFTASTETSGIVKRPVRNGDLLKLTHTTQNANEGLQALVTAAPTANALTVTFIDGPNGAAIDEAAGADINVTADVKEYQFLEAGGLSFIDGVEGITWVSKIVDDWDSADLDIYPKMYTSIEPRAKSIASLNGWRHFDQDTIDTIRDSAMERRPDANSSAYQIYALFRTNGNLHESTDQINIWSNNEPEMDAPTPLVMAGYSNQLVELYNRDLALNAVTAITQANPAVITLETGHPFSTGDVVEINDVVGMTEVNGVSYKLANVTATTAELNTTADAAIDSSGFGAYTSGGDLARDNRGIWNYRCLEHGKTHLQDTVNAQYAEIYTLSNENGLDPKLSDGAGVPLVTDVTISGGGIYANILLNEDVDSQYDFDIDSTLRSFLGYVDADGQTNQTVHTKVHYLLRQPTNINSDGTGRQIRGDKTPPITSFLGDQLTVDQYALLNYNAAERNDLRLVDDTDTTRSWPTVRIINVTAPTIAHGGTFSLIHKDTFGLSTAVYLQNDVAADQKDITIAANVAITVAFSTYNVDGHTPGQPLELVLTWNRPSFIEPGFDDTIVLSNSDITAPIQPTADPSYKAT